ncbi:MAG: DeoR/GlpR family DNA-binding transcription regulator [Microbacteriaceae bacterium]
MTTQSAIRVLPAHRLAELRSLLKSHQTEVIDLNSLADRFSVSVQTIRRDMNILAAEGLVERTFGGAVIQNMPLTLEPDVEQRENAAAPLKLAIAKAALPLINEGEAVFVDASTTVLNLIRLFPQGFPLDATTSSLQGTQQLAMRVQGNVVLLGGDYRSSADCVGGTATVEQVSRMRFSTAIISCRSIHTTQGVTEAKAEEASLKRIVISHSERVILLVDSSKFDQVSANHFAELEEIDVLVVDDQLDDQQLAQLQERVALVIVAPTS